MKSFFCFFLLLFFINSKISAQAGWSYIAVDSTTPLATRMLWKPESIGFSGNTGTTGGVYFAGTIINSEGNYDVNYWDSYTSLWGETGNINANASIYHLATNNNINPFVYASGSFTDAYGNYYVAFKSSPLSDWSELDPGDVPFQVTSNGNDTYATGDFQTITQIITINMNTGLPDTSYKYHYFTLAQLINDKWVDIGDSNINKLIYDSAYDFKIANGNITTNFSGNLFVAFPTLSENEIYAVEFDGHSWKKLGDSLPPNTSVPVINSIAVSSVGTDVYLGGSFLNSSGNYYVAHYNSGTNQWSELGGGFVPNGEVNSIVVENTNVYAAGNFTDSTGNSYVAKCDNLGNWSELGGPMLPNYSIASICSGERYIDDIYASGTFYGKNLESYLLAHYSNINCLTVNLQDSKPTYILGSLIDTFTVNTTNTGSNPNFIWEKNDSVIEGQGSPTYIDKNIKDGDKISVVVRSNSECSPGPVTDSIIIKLSSLPVDLISFQAQYKNETIVCSWQTATEINSKYFNIQRSADGVNFITIGKVNAAGKSSSVQSYNYTDNVESLSGTIYYRLAETDIDGKITLSEVRAITIPGNKHFTMSPNPARGFVTISGRSLLLVKVFDASGRLRISRTVNNQSTFSLNIITLSKGNYFVELRDGEGNMETQKLVVD